MKKVHLITFLLCAILQFVNAQERTVTGVVHDESTNDPIPGASVLVKGTNSGTITDVNGNFSIVVNDGATVLQISFIGMDTKEVSLGQESFYDISMTNVLESVDEVVVTAMGIKRETKALGYAVQKVDNAEINKVKEPNLVNALNGKIAGVNVTNSSGAPGGSSQIIIRGSTSLTGDNQPLFVVDGVPVDNSAVSGDTDTGGLSATSTYTGNRGMDLNSEDIESITVLKGPAAAALYGLKAASGAIVITTKKGKSGIPTVTFSSKMRVDVANRYPEQQTLYGQGSEGSYSDGTSDSWGAKLDSSNPVYNNVDDFFKTAYSYDVNASMSGGNESGNYYMSMHRQDQKGIVPTTNYTTNSFRLNVEEKKGWFTFGMNNNYVYSETLKTLTGSGLYGTSGDGAMEALFNWPVSDNMKYWKDESGDRVRLLPDVTLEDDVDNPYWTIHKNPITDKLHRYIGSGYITMKPLEWLSTTFRAGLDHYNQYSRNIIYPGSSVSEPYDEGEVTETQYQNDILTTNYTITADKKVNSFDLHALVGHNYEQTNYKRNKQQAAGLLSDFISINNADDDNKTYTNYSSTKRIYSVFGEVSVGYDNFLYINATARNDWSSTLSAENRSFFYPSVSGSFVFSKFLPEGIKDALSFAKIRASWSQVGKDAPVYQTATYLNTVTTIGGGYGNSYYGGNPDLKPETTESTEIGMNLKFLKGRFGVDFTYYNTKSKDQIIDPRVSMGTGYIFQYANFGTVENKGFEATITATPVKSKNWKWDATLNFSHNDGTVYDLPDGLSLLYVDDVQIGPAKAASVNEGDFLALTGEVWQKDDDGNLIIVSSTGLPETSTDATNIVGNREPDLLVGFNNSISYKNWNVSCLFDMRFGGDVYNATDYSMVYAGTSEKTKNRDTDRTFSGVVVDDDGNYSATTTTVSQDQDYYQNVYTMESSNFIQSVNWFRLRSASLTYSFPESLCKKIGFVQSFSLSATGTNLWLLTNYDGMDPEVSAGGSAISGAGTQGVDYMGVPATTSYSLGLNVKF